jgi:hypothetical protein
METFLRYISSPARDAGIDYRVAKLPLMTTSAWTVAAFASLYLMSLLVLIPNYLKNNKRLFDLRPVMLIFYGFQFGIHGIGLALFYLTMDLSTSWTCDRVNQSPTDIKTMGLIYSAYLLFSVKLVALLEPVLQAITSESYFAKDRNLIGSAVRQLVYVHLIAMAMKANPGHAFLWIAMSDMIVESVYYGYRALTSASSEMLPDGLSKWAGLISFLRAAQAATLMCHGLYLSNHTHCSMPKSVVFAECVYALLVLTLEALAFVRKNVQKVHHE